MIVDYYVLCRSQASIDSWRQRSREFPDLAFHLDTGRSSLYAFIREAISESHGDYVIISHDDVVFGRDFSERLSKLIGQVNEIYPNWGLVGNAGVAADGRTVHTYVSDPWSSPAKSAWPKPVLCVDGNMMLLNRRNFISAACEYPDLGGFHGYDLVLSLECLRKSLLVLVDHRLMVVHKSGGNQGVYERFAASEVFLDYLSGRFANKQIPTMLGPVFIPPGRDRAQYATSGDQADLYELFDQALGRSRIDRRPSLTICCRSRLWRSDLLQRAISSFSAAAAAAQELLDVRAVLLALTTDDLSETEVNELKPAWPHLKLGVLHAQGKPQHCSLGQLLVQAIAQLDTDFVWFVDEHAVVLPKAVRSLARTLLPNGGNVVVGTCVRCRKAQAASPHQQASLGEAVDRLPGGRVVNSIYGEDTIPLCGMILPLVPLRRQLDGIDQLRDDCLETLLPALALTAPQVELSILHEDIALTCVEDEHHPGHPYGDSEPDARYATCVAQLLDLPQAGNPVLWNIAAHARRAAHLPRVVRWAMDVGYLLDAVLRVLGRPRRYLGRGVAVTARSLKRGGLRALIDEAKLFRNK